MRPENMRRLPPKVVEQEQPRAPISMDVPVAPWGPLPLSLGLTIIDATRQDAEGNQEPITLVELHFIFPDGTARGIPLMMQSAQWLMDTMQEKIREHKTGLIVPTPVIPKDIGNGDG